MFRDTVVKMDSRLSEAFQVHWKERGLVRTLKQELDSTDIFSGLSRAHPEHVFSLQEKISSKFIMCKIGAELRAMNAKIKEEATRARRKLACFKADH